MTSTFEHLTINLPDDRILSYLTYGPSNGLHLLYFHGYPSSRHEGATSIPLTTATKHGLRIYALDRPGFGLSSPHPNRTISEYATDIRDFINALKLKEIAILGWSGGGPYALACAASEVLRGRLLSVGVISGAGPWIAGVQDVPLTMRIVHRATGGYAALPTRIFGGAIVGTVKFAAESRPVGWLYDRWFTSSPASSSHDGEVVSSPDVTSTFAPWAQGVSGFIQEGQLLTAHEWDFSLKDITENTILLWHGDKDENAPISHMKYVTARLPSSGFKVVEGAGHFDIWEKVDQILEAIVAEAVEKQPK